MKCYWLLMIIITSILVHLPIWSIGCHSPLSRLTTTQRIVPYVSRPLSRETPFATFLVCINFTKIVLILGLVGKVHAPCASHLSPDYAWDSNSQFIMLGCVISAVPFYHSRYKEKHEQFVFAWKLKLYCKYSTHFLFMAYYFFVVDIKKWIERHRKSASW